VTDESTLLAVVQRTGGMVHKAQDLNATKEGIKLYHTLKQLLILMSRTQYLPHCY